MKLPNALLATLFIAALPVVHAADLAITTNGQPAATVVLAESVRPSDSAVAALLSNVKQISGATLPVISEQALARAEIKDGKIIVPADFSAAVLTIPSEGVTGKSAKGKGATGKTKSARGKGAATPAAADQSGTDQSAGVAGQSTTPQGAAAPSTPARSKKGRSAANSTAAVQNAADSTTSAAGQSIANQNTGSQTTSAQNTARPSLPHNFILLGDGPLTRRLGLSLDDLGPGGIVVKTTGNTLALLSKDDGGGSRQPALDRAVYRFLEALGCRYLWPGETGKVMPTTPAITAPELNVRFTPPIQQRGIRIAGAEMRGTANGLAWLGFTVDDYRAALRTAEQTEAAGSWASWNGLGGNVGIVGGAAGGGLRGGWAEWGATHPEWFALQTDGTRDQSKAKERWRLCVSNPGLIEHVANDILARLNGHAQGIISLCPNDGGYSSFCQCEECKKLDPPDEPKVKMLLFAHVGSAERTEVEVPALTDRFVHYWNAIVERVTKVVPDQLFLVEAYSYYSDPPVREKLHPNIVVRYVPTTPEGWKGWHDAGARRLYWRPNNLHSGYRDGILSPRARETADTIHYLAQNGILATDMDSITGHWATQGLHYYVAARCDWDPSLTYDAVLDDFCKTGFGAGADAVKSYFQLAEKSITPTVGPIARSITFPDIAPGSIDEMRRQLVAAAKATENDLPSHRRVAFLRTGLEFTALSAEAHHRAEFIEKDTAPDTKAIDALMERRWQLMRAILQQQPLAVNVGVVAGNDAPLNSALNWKGPSEAGKTSKFQLPAGDNWLNEDQSATRK
ncbi:MAG TPA: DUF4838 domain-containing protein [Chthoniobacter sp.]|jgi:hypothetical protein